MDKWEEGHWRTADGLCFAMYGDTVYPTRNHLLSPFKGARLTDEENAFNQAKSSGRVCVQWEFRKVLNIFAFLDYKKSLEIHLQPVAKYYFVGSFVSNFLTCICGDQTSDYFDLMPLTIK